MEKIEKQFLVAGLGEFGQNLAITLESLGCDVIAIDSDENIVQSLSQDLTYVVCGNAADEKTLKAMGADQVDVAIIGIDNLQASVLATLILKEFGVPTIVAKATNDLHGKTLEKIGADVIIYPQRDIARRLAYRLFSERLLDYTELSDNTAIINMEVVPQFIGKNLIELNLRKEFNLNVISIQRNGVSIVNPDAHEVFQEGDRMQLFGTEYSLERFRLDLMK